MGCFIVNDPTDDDIKAAQQGFEEMQKIIQNGKCNLIKHVGVSDTGRPPIDPRVVLGSVIIKHLCNLDDRETVGQISENVYMQYFLGYSSFTTQAPFDASLFVEFRKRLGFGQLNAINERIVSLYDPDFHKQKPRAYRRLARKRYLNTAQKKTKSRKAIRAAIGGQLQYLAHNIK